MLQVDSEGEDTDPDFDLLYARFLLTHLDDPARAIAAFYRHLRPGGRVILEDIDFSGYFTEPESPAFQRYQDLYCQVVRKRGGDPNIGPRLPVLLIDGGFEHVDLHIAQPVRMQGEVKLINPLTMENIAEAVLADGLASREEIDALVRALYAFAADPRSVAGLPRIFQVWARRPISD